VEADAALAVGVALVAEGVLDGGHGAGGGAGELVGAHGERDVAVAVDLVVLEDNPGEALAGVDGEAVVLRVAARDRVAADEVGHGVVGGGAELVLSSLGGLEEHVGVAVAVELARALAREADVVTALEVGPGDVADGLRPEVLSLHDVLLGHRAGGGSRGAAAVGDGGVVEADAALAVGVALVAEGVLDGGHGAGGGAGELVGAHGERDVAVAVDLVVLEDNPGEALAGVDGEAVVLRVAARDRVAADEVGHGVVGGGAELVLSSLGGLEEHVGVAVAVELARALAREADVVTALEERGRDVHDGLGPEVLARLDLGAGHLAGARGGLKVLDELRRGGRVDGAGGALVRVRVVLVRVIHDAVGSSDDAGGLRRGAVGGGGGGSDAGAGGPGHEAGAAAAVGVVVVLVGVDHDALAGLQGLHGVYLDRLAHGRLGGLAGGARGDALADDRAAGGDGLHCDRCDR